MTPEIDAIKAEFEACTSIEEVNAKAQKHGPRVAALRAEGGESKLGAIHITNLAGWMRREIKRREKDA
ncbi:hypothetical protein [Mesobacterium pallidum]|uniref:hypothetical protein n=1 Tax=Mesobacterium pallidum TaxID=2872037 RepID=UPI001EE29C86|nr:hypothetical protein [Mesobacterium pallidum]